MTVGINIAPNTVLDRACETCRVAKSLRTVSREPQKRPEKAFQVINVDVDGPITPTGIGGCRWGLLITDSAVSTRWGFTYKTKAEAFDILVNFVVGVERQYGRKVEIIRMDNGTEFGGHKLEVWAAKAGIKMEPTVPYTPEQDGIAERSFRTVFERVRSITIDHQVPKQLWPELFKGVVYTMNRTATSTLKGMTPYEALSRQVGDGKGRRLPVDHLRVLSCKAVVHIQAPRRTKSDKLSPRRETGILVGYEGNYIYRV